MDETPTTDKTIKPQAQPSKSTYKTEKNNKIQTLASLNEPQSHEDDDKQAYYAGGSEKSGQLILGSDPKDKNKYDNTIENIFKNVLNHGAREINPALLSETLKSLAPKNDQKKLFSGKGCVLGDTSDDTLDQNFVNSSENATRDLQTHEPHTTGTTPAGALILRMWKDGFTVSESEHEGSSPKNLDPDELLEDLEPEDLRSYGNPENQRFLSAIMKGEVPDEMASTLSGRHLNLIIEDHRSLTLAEKLEELAKDHGMEKGERGVRFAPLNKPNNIKVKPFSGQGHLLGSPSPNVVLNQNTNNFGILKTSNAPSSSSSSQIATSNISTTSFEYSIEGYDPNKPETILQIRLEDGTKISLKCNTIHTIEDVRLAIVRYFPKYEAKPFKLMASFPRKELENINQTLEEANVLNSVIIHRSI